MNPFKYLYKVVRTTYLNLRFPFLCYRNKNGKHMWIYPYNWYCWIPTGWKKAFGIQMCKEIKQYLKKSPFTIYDIKEKFGRLDISYTGGNKDIDKILMKYEYISERTCIICGKLATGYTPIESWQCPYCDTCKPENKLLIEYGISVEINEKKYNSLDWYGYTGNINHRNDNTYINEYKQYCEHF